MKKRTLTPEELQECAALKEIYRQRKAETGITQERLASELGMNQGSLSHYLNGRNALNLGFALSIAPLLGVSVEAFSPRIAAEIQKIRDAIGDGRKDFLRNSATKQREIVSLLGPKIQVSAYPVLEWHEATEFLRPLKDWSEDSGRRYEASSFQSDLPCYWLEVQGDSMTAPSGLSIPEGALILVEAGASPKPGSLIVATPTEANEPTFKRFVQDGRERYLKPLNPAYPVITMENTWKVLGVVREAKVVI